jgi:hypothetical protein
MVGNGESNATEISNKAEKCELPILYESRFCSNDDPRPVADNEMLKRLVGRENETREREIKLTWRSRRDASMLTVIGIVAVSLTVVFRFIEYCVQDFKMELLFFITVTSLLVLGYAIGFITIVIIMLPIIIRGWIGTSKENK